MIGSVLVMGGGISGIQAALDLAESGFFVYLVEKKPAIGGVMPQLDKTFPTNDCSMCTLAPKLVEAGRHLNIEIITQAELASLEGEAGCFTATLRQEPRYVDPERCNGCGLCAEVCPVDLISTFDEGLSTRRAIYRKFPQAIPDAFGIKKFDRAPCTLACPVEINIQGYIQLIKMGKYEEAIRLIMERLPLPGVLGRICPHPCEEKCRRQELDEPVAICALGRFAADQVDLATITPPPGEARAEKIAIIGSGPAGLACAYYLALRGYRPTIFEALPQAGGMLRVGIPDYRLPKDVLDQEIENILRLGVDLKTNTSLGKDITLDELFEQGYKAVFLGIGCHVGRSLKIPGEEVDGVIQGVEFLRKMNLSQSFTVGQRLAVIGGGNVAIDVACTARRLGSEVTIVYRRSREEMPAFAHEIEQAVCEGVEIVYLAAPLKVLTSPEGKVTGLLCQRMELGEPDASGRRQPRPISGAEFELPVDMVVPAIGQEADLSPLEASGITISRHGTVEVDEVTYQTSRPGVFAAGDVHTGPWIAIEAVGGGIEVAESIDRYLRDLDLAEGRVRGKEAQARWREIPRDEEGRPRELMAALPPEYTCSCFDEIFQGYTEAQAQAEAARCLNCGGCCECMQCVAACEAKAIDHTHKPKTRSLEVGAVILASGFQLLDPRLKPEFGYGRYPNVVTSLEFERFLSTTGPTQAHIKRPSDGADPTKIAWIQCVGSRDSAGGRDYCSAVCCMYATKQAIIAGEHDAHIEPTIFFIDLRAHGKGFERYYQKAKADHNIRYIRSMISRVTQDPRSQNLKITYVEESNGLKTEEFDLVVLSMGLGINSENQELARNLGIEISPNNFVATSCFTPVRSSRPGIFACGTLTGPKDIPDSLMEGSAGAASAAQVLSSDRGTLVKAKEFPVERAVGDEEPRIGVFVCHCGLNIGGVADIAQLVETARQLPHVEYAEDTLFTCSQDSQNQIAEVIREHRLNRIVVAACSPHTHGPPFQTMLRESGLNKYLFEMANIRNQCTWVHQAEPGAATAKCDHLIRMAVAKARLLTPLDYLTVPVNKTALVIGGGMAGMNSALALADQGFPVHLVERLDHLGGNARKLQTTWRGEPVQVFVERAIKLVEEHGNITVHYDSIVTEVSGTVGAFTSKLSSGAEIDHGVVIIAIGAEPLRPEGHYLYQEHPDVLLSLDLDREIVKETPRVKGARAAAFIQCVGSRIPERPYCMRLCCSHSVENAIRLKELNPNMEVSIIYRDLRTYGEREALYTKARQMGVRFFRYAVDEPPEVTTNGDGIQIRLQDQNLGQPLQFEVDLLTLASAIVPHYNAPLAELYKIPLNAEGFFTEAHLKIKPVEATSEGIFMAGLCHYPKPIQESIVEALATASRAATILSKDSLLLESTISRPLDENCDGCAFCVDACPFKAITLLEYMKEGGVKKTVEVNEVLCKGCGSCMATCPKRGIDVQGFTLDQLAAQVDAALEVA